MKKKIVCFIKAKKDQKKKMIFFGYSNTKKIIYFRIKRNSKYLKEFKINLETKKNFFDLHFIGISRISL